MEDKDKLIASLRQQLRQEMAKNSALEQENALLNNELEELKNG
ncbi:MAG: hypothetical protein ACRCUJ_07760 [Phocaeicola sp.]